jgi:succinate dehydrogenase / fumarate reductase flavoprotein subunit/fumarate reductase flavoprotein subunit
MMGGVTIDTQTRSRLEGLHVAGEDAAGVHGANRLGGNGVAESTVFGCIAGDIISETLPERRSHSEAQIQTIVDEALSPMTRSSGENVFAIRTEMRTLMWEKVGLVRNGAELISAIDELDALAGRLNRASIGSYRNYNLEWNEYLNLRNFLLVSRLIAVSALARQDSRGSHFRTDFPRSDDEHFLNNVHIARDFKVSFVPVRLDRMKPS